MGRPAPNCFRPVFPEDRMAADKKVFVKTYGCQMNVYDSERMTAALGAQGYAPTENPADADLVLLNTCHIREKAAEKVYSELGRLKGLKTARPGMMIGVTGCVAQAEGAEIIARAPVVDLVVGPQAYHRLPSLIARREAGERPVETEFPPEDKFDHLPEPSRGRRAPAAFLTVQEGCDKFCAFCVVPYTRGAEVSRPAARIEAEARGLVERGVVEITLLGQNVNAYRDSDAVGLAALVRRLARIEGLERIRYTTSHPNDMDDDLIAAHGDEAKLMPFLHLPVQSGSDRVLKAMNRRHRGEDYLRLVERIRAARPDMAMSGDFIVGFPGETEADFAETLALVQAVGYAQAFSFAYSARPGTPAAGRPGVAPEVAFDRLHRLQALLARQQAAFQAGLVGRMLPVLIEKRGREAEQMAGRSPYLNAVHLDAPRDLVGRVVPVRILAASSNSLAGELAA
jgi:tRNA-2-methylthio-N6-dimethylallyladenosine synthase